MKKLLLIAICSGLLFGCNDTKKAKTITETKIEFVKEGELTLVKSDGTHMRTLDIEIADDDYQRETGLMHRSSMGNHQGMLFIFEEEANRGFYMKNTLISLDIIYIDKDGKIVSFAENAKPLDETSLPSEVPAQYVLEINGGLSEEWLLEIGDTIEWERL